MANIVELRRKIEDIKTEYDLKMRPIKDALAKLQTEKEQALVYLEVEYSNMCEAIIENHKSGTITKIPNVSVRSLNDFEIVDKNLVPLDYYEWSLSTKKIKEALVESNYTESIPGVKQFKKYSVAVKI